MDYQYVGEWKKMHLIYRNHTIKYDMLRHFYGGGPKEAMKFTNIWIPYNCSYHRFTNVTVDKCITYLLRSINNNHQNVDINDHEHTSNMSDQYADHQSTNTSYDHFHDHDNSYYYNRSHNGLHNISSNHHNYNQNHHHHHHDNNNNELNYSQYDYNISKHHNNSYKIINNHHYHHHSKIRKKLRIVFFGDSATRGIINGITRILSGSEIYGPCVSDICGRPGAFPPSEREHNQHKIYTFHHQLIITFIYTKSLTIPYTLQHIESIIKENKTYALILNTGAWDFDHISRAYKNNTAIDECGKQAMHEVSKLRTSSIINESMWRFSELSEKYHTRIIYRNNHFNRRFGTICADAEFESMIYGSNWEIWNNREISRESWIEVCYIAPDSSNDVMMFYIIYYVIV